MNEIKEETDEVKWPFHGQSMNFDPNYYEHRFELIHTQMNCQYNS